MQDDKSPLSWSKSDTLPVKCGSLLVLEACAKHIPEGEVVESAIHLALCASLMGD